MRGESMVHMHGKACLYPPEMQISKLGAACLDSCRLEDKLFTRLGAADPLLNFRLLAFLQTPMHLLLE